jgi:AmmeMemoRadiSam system protein B
MLPFEQLIQLGQAIASVLAAPTEPVLLLATSDLNHYQDDATTREKDRKAIDHMLALDSRGLYDTCHREAISMCGLAAAVTMLAALGHLGAKRAELVRYATSADISGNRSAVVGYAGMLFD